MTLKDLTEAVAWLKKNGKREITAEEKKWAKEEIEKAVTINDLVSVVFEFVNRG